MKKTNINKYYEKNNGKVFLVSSLSLFTEQEINKYTNNPREFVNFDVDTFNFFLVKVAVAIELSLKGLAVHKRYNIFRMESNKLLNYENLLDISNLKTYELGFFIDNLSKLLPKNYQTYKESFKYFQKLRNEYIHFSKNVYKYDHPKIIKHLNLIKQYFNDVIRPLKDTCSLEVRG